MKKRRGKKVADCTEGASLENIEKDWVHGAGAGEGAASDVDVGVGAEVNVDENIDSSPSTKKKSARKPCGSCGKLVGGTLKCGRCKSTCYCNLQCQKAHWKDGGHKQECRTPPTKAAKPRPAATVLALQMEGMSLGSDSGRTAARDSNDEVECAICLDPVDGTNSRQLPCGHVYHRECVQELRKRGVNDLCPQCRAPLPPGAEESHCQATMLLVRAQRMPKGSEQDRLYTEAENLYREVLQEDPQHVVVHTPTSA
jgi:hypothetical protein